ncbi:hypothetical protein SUGI_0303750 [Cryptomeria japonica]|nr:hypothetical protein SUGI_0303750 [Cryptomeria japonica]
MFYIMLVSLEIIITPLSFRLFPFVKNAAVECSAFLLELGNSGNELQVVFVASSQSKIFGLFSISLAIAIRCFCPPESCAPLSSTWVLWPLGRFSIKEWTLAAFAHLSLYKKIVEPKYLYLLQSKATGSLSRGPCILVLH